MRAVFAKIISDIRRRRIQTAVIVIIVVLASSVATMALTLMQEASGPFDHAFAQQRGAHLVALFDPTRVTAAQLRAAQHLPGVTAVGGPWPARDLAFEGIADPRTGLRPKFGARVIGRSSPGGAVERLRMVAGRWVRSSGEIVLTRALATTAGTHTGDHIYILADRMKVAYVVVGEAVDINLPSIWTPQKAWVLSTDPIVARQAAPLYEVAYRFKQAATPGDAARDRSTVTAQLPSGALIRSFSWLDARQGVNVLATLVLTFLLAFSLLALVACALIVANVVAGAVLAGYREIGILKGIGFTPAQVVGSFVGQMLLPSVLGCAIGIPLGALGSYPILQNVAGAMDLPAPSSFVPGLDVLVLLGILTLVAASAAIPARHAGRLNAVRAIARGSTDEHGRSSRLSRLLDAWRLPRYLSLGAGLAFARRLRGMLTMVAVLIGVTTLTFAFGFHLAMGRLANDPALHSRDFVGGNYQIKLSPQGGFSDAQVMRLLSTQPGTQYVVAYADAFVTAPGVSDPLQVIGVRGDATRLGYHAQSGRWFRGTNEVVLGGAAFKETHARLGGTITLTFQGRQVLMRVVGTYFDITNTGRVMRFSYADLLRFRPGTPPSSYAVQLMPGTDAAAYARRIRAAEPDYVALELNDQSMPEFAILDQVVTALAVILGLIAVVGVFNTVLLNARERMRNVAVLKALGMSPRQTIIMVTASACVIGVLGGLLGVPTGVFLQRQVLTLMADMVGSSMPVGTAAVFNPALLSVLGLAGVALSVVGGSLPARWAANSPVVEVLHAE